MWRCAGIASSASRPIHGIIQSSASLPIHGIIKASASPPIHCIISVGCITSESWLQHIVLTAGRMDAAVDHGDECAPEQPAQMIEMESDLRALHNQFDQMKKVVKDHGGPKNYIKGAECKTQKYKLKITIQIIYLFLKKVHWLLRKARRHTYSGFGKTSLNEKMCSTIMNCSSLLSSRSTRPSTWLNCLVRPLCLCILQRLDSKLGHL